MLGKFGLGCCSIFLFLSFISLEAINTNRLEDLWGLTSLNEKLQHPLEKVELSKDRKTLTVTTWYEDLTASQGAAPDQRLLCRFMHNFVYGRAQLRSEKEELPPSLAFRADRRLEKIKFQFIAVRYRNQPTSPYWDIRPSVPPAAQSPDAQLRVLWTREEVVIPYLSLEINRTEWQKLADFLQGRPFYSYSAFRQNACSKVYEFVPNVRSNFKALLEALGKNF